MSADKATLIRAWVREKYSTDEEQAGEMLYLSSSERRRRQGSSVKPDPKGKDRKRIQLHGLPWSYVVVSAAAGDIPMGGLYDEQVGEERVFDPVRKVDVGKSEADGGASAVELLAKQVADKLHDKSKKRQ